MFRVLLLLFITIPILEIYLLIKVGERIGLVSTLLAIILTAVIGASLVRNEGLKTLYSLQERLNNNELPGKELADGAMLLIAGVLLVTPGFFTDGVGFFLAFPVTRALLRNRLMAAFAANINSSGQGFHTGTQGFYYTSHDFTEQNPQDGSTIEGEFKNHQEQPGSPDDDRPDSKHLQ